MGDVVGRRLLLACAALLIVVALLVVLVVIPAVASDPSPQAAPDRAVPAFWMNSGLTLLAAAACAMTAGRLGQRTRAATTSLAAVGIVALLLGLALADAGAAYRSHDQALRTATAVLFVCSALDVLVAAAVVALVVLRTKRR